MKKKLLLLGAWNEPPLVGWDWFNERAMAHFIKLTGVKTRCLTFLKNGLHYQYFLLEDADKLFRKFERLDSGKKLQFVKKILADYFKQAAAVKRFLSFLKKIDFPSLSDDELVKIIEEWMEKLPLVTMQIWFVVLLDIWYPDNERILEIKKIAAEARDDDGYLQESLKTELKKMVLKISRRLRVSIKEVTYLFPQEIISILEKEQKMPNVGERLKLFATVYSGNRYKILSGEKARLALREYDVELQPKEKLNLLTGLSASHGRARGKAQIVLFNKQFTKFKKGNILVALQTMVNYVPVMRKAGAILTELGGLTSHAAIVSRELKKPCIVGIKNLTSSVKDGDLLEVDANKGVVRLCRKATADK